jgi:hypothetical protein
MYFKKSAHPIGPGTSNGGVSVHHALDPEAGGLNSSARTRAVSKTDAEAGRIQELPLQANHDPRKETTSLKLLLVKPAAQRRQYAYLISYARLRELLGFAPNDDEPVVLNDARLQHAVRMLLRAVHVDEDWYGRQNPDVKEAIAKGVFRSAKHHFVESGYFEGRKPAPVLVDEEWYKQAYPDVSESVEFGELGSCQEHFDRYGEGEGRLPAED